MTTAMNRTNASCTSDLRIDKSAVENILRLSHNYATHVIEIKVSVNSGNKIRELKWSWAEEIGRTIISLKTSYSQVSPFHFVTLNPGIKKVNVVVENYGCLPNGSNGSEIIFDFLLHQLFRSDDNDDYKLCRVINGNDDVKQHNCCRIASGGNLTICDEYLSVLLEYAKYYIFAMVSIMTYVGFPLIMQHLQSIPKETEHYSITDSPMALSRIFYAVFLERSNNPVTPYYRRLTFSLIVTVETISITGFSLPWIIVSLTWALFFTAYDVFGLNGGATKNIDIYLIILTLPFNVKHWWKFLKLPTKEEPSVLQEEDPQVTTSEQTPESSGTKICCSITTKVFKTLFFVIAYIVAFIPICVSILAIYSGVTLLSFIVSPIQIVLLRDDCSVLERIAAFLNMLSPLIYIFHMIITVIFSILSLNLLFCLIIGLYLNGSFFSPIVVPILILLVYSWKNWRSFVETKYLQLKTAIYECCEEYYEKKSSEKKKENEESKRDASVPTTSSSTIEKNHQESEETTDDSNESYVVNVEEGTVSKALYDKIREHKLPYYNVLFYFSMRMFLVANFSLIVFVMMSLAQKSNIAVPVQIMSTIAVSTLPLIFETIWADHSFEQKNVNRKKLKQDLRSSMEMEIKTDNIVTVQLMLQEKITKNDPFEQSLGRIFNSNRYLNRIFNLNLRNL